MPTSHITVRLGDGIVKIGSRGRATVVGLLVMAGGPVTTQALALCPIRSGFGTQKGRASPYGSRTRTGLHETEGGVLTPSATKKGLLEGFVRPLSARGVLVTRGTQVPVLTVLGVAVETHWADAG